LDRVPHCDDAELTAEVETQVVTPSRIDTEDVASVAYCVRGDVNSGRRARPAAYLVQEEAVCAPDLEQIALAEVRGNRAQRLQAVAKVLPQALLFRDVVEILGTVEIISAVDGLQLLL